MAKTFCRICEAACGLTFEEGRLRPDREHPVSRGFVCAKGTRFLEVAHDASRVTQPLVREGAGWRAVDWTRALAEAGDQIRRTQERHGPHAVGLYIGNPLAFNALGQLSALLFARALGTRNVFTAGSQDCNNKFAGASLLHGSPVIHPIPDFEHAELAVLFGTNPAVSQSSFVHLEGGAGIFDRMTARGARLVWVDVRETESARRWGELLTIRPGADVWLLLALLGLCSPPEPDPRVEGFEALHAVARTVTPELAEQRTGIAADRIRALARDICTHRTALHMSVGVNQGPFGTLSYVALQGLAYASGNYDRRGGSIFSPLAVGGARLAHRAGFFRADWASRVGGFRAVFDSLPAGVMADEIVTDGPERVRTLVVIAGDPLRSVPGSSRLSHALGELDALICVDLFESLTGSLADVILPATSWLERADLALPGLPLQTVDLLQTTRAMMPRVGESRPEHEILAALSLAAGRPLLDRPRLAAWLAGGPNVGRALPLLTDLAWWLTDRAPTRRGYGIRVPVPRAGTYLGRGPMTPGSRVRFWHPELEQEHERLFAAPPPSVKGAFRLVGRRRRLGHNSWLHGGTRVGPPEAVAWLAPSDARRLGVADGDQIALRTEAGSIRLPAISKRGVPSGVVVVPHGERDININEILPAGADQIERLSGNLHMTGIPVEVDALVGAGVPVTA